MVRQQNQSVNLGEEMRITRLHGDLMHNIDIINKQVMYFVFVLRIGVFTDVLLFAMRMLFFVDAGKL